MYVDIIPLYIPHYVSSTTTFFRSGNKYVGAPPPPPPHPEASRHFSTPNKTPWSRPWYISSIYGPLVKAKLNLNMTLQKSI